ncbi:MAG: hypothetical protein CMH56_08175 [Myxococcales bacterium]|nr:hypothetical protein [Myxococcales bacterium]|tara:strand:+ start:5256 stop:6191 length:936 start_codon:yes stop_codon:yes gene_type:complete
MMPKALLVCLTFFLMNAGSAAAKEPASQVFLNGVPTPVFFNDGDSFRVLEGPLKGTKARLAGFNTLESYGPVHQWGTWHAKELYAIAKMATLNARRGVWNCSSEMEKDTYGRVLFDCLDLAEDQIRKGLAHVMSVTTDPGHPRLVAAQKDAIENRAGMWAHGVPEFVLTSLHSIDERSNRAYAYNRLVSSIDGHSEKWMHKNKYTECQVVCEQNIEITDADLAQLRKTLLRDVNVKPILGGTSAQEVDHIIRMWLKTQTVAAIIEKRNIGVMKKALAALKSDGMTTASDGSCVVYVDFKRRFGGDKAKCLK